MILQALNQYYDRLVEAGILERPGWQPVRVSYALQITKDGNLERVLPLLHEEERGKKKALVPQTLNLPAQEKRAVGIVSNFLCDNSSYMLGIDNKGKPDRSRKCFEACRDLHISLLDGVHSESAQALVNYFRKWQPEDAMNHKALKPYLDEIMGGANLVFDYKDQFAQTDPEIQEAWNKHYASPAAGEQMQCLVTGQYGSVARLHPSIKGVAGGQPMGTSLVSFNASAFESFARDGGQGYNAPVSEKAAFAYSAALNYMIAKNGHHLRLSDMTLVFWAETGEPGYAETFSAMMGDDEQINEDDLFEGLKNLAAGRNAKVNEIELNPGEHFYILGLSPNAARLSVRFFLQDSFGHIADHMMAHHERLSIIRPAYDSRQYLNFWHLLNETVNPKSRDKTPSPLLAGALVRSVLTGMQYPQLLLDQVEIRIRAEKTVSRGKAAIIKASLLKRMEVGNIDQQCKEALCMELNQNTTYQPYLLGRLFAVLEGLQQAANPGINSTIRDRYFNSACATPAVVFPQLIKLSQAHLKKLEKGNSIYYSKQISEILNRFDQNYPSRLNLYDQGIFQLGYYHQTQARYVKKEDK